MKDFILTFVNNSSIFQIALRVQSCTTLPYPVRFGCVCGTSVTRCKVTTFKPYIQVLLY